jgi:hypothetical protein
MLKIMLVLIILGVSSMVRATEIIEGTLQPGIEDHFQKNKSIDVYHLNEDKTEMILILQFKDGKVPPEIQRLKAGSKIKIRGQRSNGKIEFEALLAPATK